MVRDVPKVTIDIGDRKLQRTVMGNTVLYLCTSEGTVVDFWPGVYLPEHFLPELKSALQMLRVTSGAPTVGQLQRWHARSAADSGKKMEISRSKREIEAPILKGAGM